MGGNADRISVGDQLLSVDGEDATSWSLQHVSKLMKEWDTKQPMKLGFSAKSAAEDTDAGMEQRAGLLLNSLNSVGDSSGGTNTLCVSHRLNQQNDIGGRFGNMLFQYAAGLGTARAFRLEFLHAYHWLYLPFDGVPTPELECSDDAVLLREDKGRGERHVAQ